MEREDLFRPHEHWHVDISYPNIGGTFYYLLSIPGGDSLFIVRWEIRESMPEAQKAKEKYPGQTPARIISDNGTQFIVRDYKEFIRISGMGHVMTSPYYPQTNGRVERWRQSLKSE